MRSFTKKTKNNDGMNSILNKEFTSYNNGILYQRVKLISYMLIFSYPCFFVVDFFFFRSLDLSTFKFTLSIIHITGLVISLVFIFMDRIKRIGSTKVIIHSYILLYLLIGAVSSINSQRFTGNIYAYIIILLGVAVIFPIRPRNLCFLFSVVHVFFIAGLFLMEHNYFSFLSKMINSTGTAVIAFTISLSFHTFRKNDFFNKQKLKRNEKSFRQLFNMNPNPLILMTQDLKKILLVNRAAMEYYHLDNKDTEIMDAGFLFSSSQERLDILTGLDKLQTIKNYVVEQQIASDVREWSLLSFELVDYLDNTCILIGATDITELKEKEEELYQHASIDLLTGVMNRRSGLELLNGLLSGGGCSQEFIICYIDINNLKMVNDLYGHSMGDDLIKTCCDIINRQIHHDDVLFRMGGDEFIIVFFQKQMQDVLKLLELVNREFLEINQSNQKPFSISASHGLYHYKPGMVITVEEILEWADQEMYKNKFLHKTLNQ